jgi:[NiFe] hydrogenase large subunit
MSTIVIDPVTRIEGHLRMETEISNGRVSNAWSCGTLFRGIEPILKDRDPRDAWMFTQRLCGVCTYVHGVTSVRSVENALAISIPENARVIRNLLMGSQFIHDHIVNFYQLHLVDWIDVVSALSADPAAAVSVDRQINPARTRDASFFATVKQRLQTFAESGQLGPFANGYWGHPAYILTPEENLVFMADYLEALRVQVQVAHMHAILGGKNPHPQTMIVGGVTLNKDLKAPRISEFKNHIDLARNFVDDYYLPDTVYLLSRYKEYATIGEVGNLMSFGEFPQSEQEESSLFFRRGIIYNRATGNVVDVDIANITESVTHSWYSGGDLNPAQGQTEPNYTGLETGSKYSWIKAPRYQGQTMEVGPLARVMVNYGTGHQPTVAAVDAFLQQVGLPLSAMYSLLGRTAARTIETKIIADVLRSWSSDLVSSSKPFTMPFRTQFTMADTGSGAGLNEAPRGALGHWVSFSGGKVTNYQMVVPSTWNFGPRDANDEPGPVERALVGVPVADQERPLEVLRLIHSFNPCIACAVHVFSPEAKSAFSVSKL